MTHTQHCTALLKTGLSVSVAQQTKVPYFDKPVREHMEQEPPDELSGIKGHGLFGIPVSVVLPEEGDLPGLYADETMIGKSDPVGIASQILDHRFGTVKRRLAVDHPFPAIEPLHIRLECCPVLFRGDGAGEAEFICLIYRA